MWRNILCRHCGEPLAKDNYLRRFWVSLFGGMHCPDGSGQYHEPEEKRRA